MPKVGVTYLFIITSLRKTIEVSVSVHPDPFSEVAMARPKSSKPAYCLHKLSGRAFVKLDGKQLPLGRHGSAESKNAYDRVIGEWIGRGCQSAPTVADTAR